MTEMKYFKYSMILEFINEKLQHQLVEINLEFITSSALIGSRKRFGSSMNISFISGILTSF